MDGVEWAQDSAGQLVQNIRRIRSRIRQLLNSGSAVLGQLHGQWPAATDSRPVQKRMDSDDWSGSRQSFLHVL